MEPIGPSAAYTGDRLVHGDLGEGAEMQIVVWVLAACALLVIATLVAAMIDRRAGWNQIPLELDSSRDVDEHG
jgi:hypothetical protein